MSGQSALDHAAENADPNCAKCKGTGSYMYDRNHGTVCDLCCKHDLGWWQLRDYYGANNGKFCCSAGCGKVIESLPHDTIGKEKT